MLILKAQLSTYRSRNTGSLVVPYTVASDLKDAAKATKEIEEYKTKVGDNLVMSSESNEPMFFGNTTKQEGLHLKFGETKKRYYVATDLDALVEAQKADDEFMDSLLRAQKKGLSDASLTALAVYKAAQARHAAQPAEV